MADTNKVPFTLPSGVYDGLKDTALIYLPAGASLYLALSVIWGFPNAEQVTGTAVALETFLGVVLKINKTVYDNSPASKQGIITVDRSDLLKDRLVFEPTVSLDQISDSKTVTFAVENVQAELPEIPVEQVESPADPRIGEHGVEGR